MSHDPRRAALKRTDFDSLFPPQEPGSFCSRPTPVVPASEELRALGTRSHPPEASGEILRPSSRPTSSFGLESELAYGGYDVVVERDATSMAPPRDVPSTAPPRAARPRGSRARAVVSKLLFAMLFAGVATLFGFALKKKLAASGYAPDASGIFARGR